MGFLWVEPVAELQLEANDTANFVANGPDLVPD
jgi:hypothetical protein